MKWFLSVATTCAAGLLLALMAVAAPVYKSVDSQGRVIYSDVPPSGAATAVELPAANIYTPELPTDSGSTSANATDPATASDTEISTTEYVSVAIITPAHDAALRNNSGQVQVVVSTTPALDLAAGHQLRLLLDQQPISAGPTTQFTLDNVDRGTHSLSAQIVNAQGELLLQSASSTFHLLRYSALTAPNRANPARGR